MQISSSIFKRWYFGTSLIFFLLIFVNAQTHDVSPGRKKLTPADFKGVPDEKQNYFARTFSVISLKYYNPTSCTEKGKVRLKAETNISVSEKSWMKLDRIKSKELLNELLAHEQGHYDIGETFAIDLKNAISNRCFDKARYKAQADSLFRSMNVRYDSIQRKYDLETDYMRNRKMQLRWKADIAAMLERVSRK